MKTISQSERIHWHLASILILLAVMLRYLTPVYDVNESVYLLGSKKLLDPDFLTNDWTIMQETVHLSFIFELLFAAVLWVVGDSMAATLATRLLAWGLTVYAISKLARVLGVPWYVFMPAMMLYVYSAQSLAAAEWLFGGAEQKVFAYALLILALSAALEHKNASAGVFCGSAVMVHVLVGGWGTTGVFCAYVLNAKYYQRKEALVSQLLRLCRVWPWAL
jgi:hypothetical protein